MEQSPPIVVRLGARVSTWSLKGLRQGALPGLLGRLWLTASLLVFAAAASGCDGCDLTSCSCTSGCFDDCADCDGCGACSECDCESCEGCTILPIPGGFPAAERIPHATQVRLSPGAIQFLEDNLSAIAEPFLPEDLLGANASFDNLSVPILGIQAVLIDAVVVHGAAGVCFQSSPFRSASATSGAFDIGIGHSAEFTVSEPTAAMAITDAGLISSTIARHVAIQVRDGGGNWVNVCRNDAVFLVSSVTEPLCGADLVPNRTYRLETGIGAPLVSVSAELFLADNDRCKAQASVRNVDLSAVEGSPDRLRVDVAVRARTQLPVRGFGIVPDCTFDFNTELGPNTDMRFRAELAIVEETSGPRTGIGKLEVVTARFLDPGLESEDMSIQCGGLIGLVLSFFEGPLYGTIEQTIEGLVNEQDLITQVASIPQSALPDPTNGNARTICPSGSVVDPDDLVGGDSDGLCYLDPNGNGVRDSDENETAPLLLGAEGRLDMGEFISSFSPGLRSAVDILFAVDGEGDATPGNGGNGYTVDFFGGFDSVQLAGCVNELDPPLSLPDVVQAAAFRGADDAHHISVGLSEEVMNYGAYQLWRSGALCIDATTRLDQSLASAGAFRLLSPSGLGRLTFPFQAGAIGIQVRPQQPPIITLGRGLPGDEAMGILPDPFLSIVFPQLDMHFYIFTSERYVRFMTLTGDLTVDILRLPMTDGIIQFGQNDIAIDIARRVVTNSELINVSPEVLASNFGSAINLAQTMVGGSIPPIDVNALVNNPLLPVGVQVADDFVRLVESDGERFLGVFLDMAMPTPAPLVQRAQTELELLRVSVPEDTRAFELPTFGQGELPSVEIAMTADGHDAAEYEYQYRVDGGIWSGWTRSPYAVISDLSFALEGRHSVEARARVVGSVASADNTPARTEFLIDLTAPRVETVLSEGGTTLRADDIVSSADALQYRYRALGSGQWSGWRPLGASEQLLADARGPHEFEVRDEAGNVGRNEGSLRGLPPPSDSAGCGDCAAGEADPTRPLYGLLLLVGLCALLRRRRAL